MEKTINVFTDGGARGNPGPAAVGIVAYDNKEEVFRMAHCIGRATNNVAEYTALDFALAELLKRKISNVVVNMDSELVVKQLNKEYRVKDEQLKILYERVTAKSSKFVSVKYNHVRRVENKLADKLVNNALDNPHRHSE